ncbi:MAG: transposase [Dehalococcoidales bacterium]|nr:transposase [Dehalococcoidales bacterium]
MKQTLMIKLAPTKEQHQALLTTMETFNVACTYVADVAFNNKIFGKYRLQKSVYTVLRDEFNLSAQMAIRAIAKVSEGYKADKKSQHVIKPHSAVVYDQRILSWKGRDMVSILTLQGRQMIPVRVGDYQEGHMDRRVKQTDLVLQKGVFYLAVIVDIPEPATDLATGSMGVDLGVTNLAVDNDGQFYSGEDVDKVRENIDALKADLQSKGTKSAKRHLRKLGGRESRFRRSVNHRISKKLVAKAKDTHRCISLEDLSGIGDSTVRHSQRRRHKSWAFNQLRTFIEYKAKIAGVMVRLVNPRNTSRECPQCHHISKSNRRSQSLFLCQHCGYSLHADVVGAINISRKASVNVPIVSPGLNWGWAGTSSPALAVSG